MSRVLSLRDIKLIPELSQYDEVELIHPDMDDTMKKYLAQLGFDLDYQVEYVPSKHRDMQGKVAVGYQVVGYVSINRNFINSPMCSLTDRLVAASHSDLSLMREMVGMMGGTKNYYSYLEDVALEGDGEYADADIEEDRDLVLTQIKKLEMVRDEVRGMREN